MNQNHYGESEPFQMMPSQYYKTVENFLKKLAFKLGNTPSATEVKVISCIPIDVSDLQYRILSLEKQLKESKQEKRNKEGSSYPSRRNSTEKMREGPKNEYREENIVNNVVILPSKSDRTRIKQHNGLAAAIAKSRGDSKDQRKRKAKNQVNTVFIRESDKSNNSSLKMTGNSCLSYMSTASSERFFQKTNESRESYNFENEEHHIVSFTALNTKTKDNDVKILYKEKPKGSKGKQIKSVYRRKYTTTPISIQKTGLDWRGEIQPTPKFTCSTEKVMNQIKDIFGNVINEFKQNKCNVQKHKRRNYPMQYQAQMFPLNPFFYPVPAWGLNPKILTKLDEKLHKSLETIHNLKQEQDSGRKKSVTETNATEVKKSKSVIQIHVKFDRTIPTEIIHKRPRNCEHAKKLKCINEGIESDGTEVVIDGTTPQYMISQHSSKSRKLPKRKISFRQRLKSIFVSRR